MPFRRRFLTLALAPAAALALSACASAPQEPEPPLDRPARQVSAEELARCNAAGLADAVGRQLVQGTAGPDAVSTSALPENHRIVRPGQMVTMDYVPDRLTVHTNRGGIITKLTCG